VPRKERLIFGHLLVLALVLTHAALMATDHHSVAMEPLSALTEVTDWSVDLLATLGAGGHEHSSGRERMPAAPHPVLGDCPAQQAVLPLLLVLVILVALAFARGGTTLVASGLPRHWPAWWSLPPPLPASRRRALLQVFRN
jgi:hypothetical protein